MQKLIRCIFENQIYPEDTHILSELASVPETPSVFHQLNYLSTVFIYILNKIVAKITKTQELWSVAITKGNWTNIDMKNSFVIDNPDNHYLADPFVINENNSDYCFVEDFDIKASKGSISVYKILDNTAMRVGNALVEPFHLAFPFLFRFESKIYMLPETSENRDIILSTVNKTAKNISIPLTVGGGVKTLEDIRNLLLAGADKVSINTAAVNNKNLVKESAEKFGSQCIVVAVDAKKVKENKWEIFTHGGRKSTGIDALKFVEKMESMGAGEILLTSMDRDGTKKGYDLDLTKKISNLVNIPVIASGGVGSLEHLHQGIKIGKANAVLAASIFHFGEFSIQDAKKYLDSKGIPVRI